MKKSVVTHNIKDIGIKPVKVKVEGKTYYIDVPKEFHIDKNNIETQLRDSSFNLFILSTVRDYLIKKRDTLAIERDKAYSNAWIFYKEANARWNNDYVDNKSKTNSKYLSLCERYIQACEKASKFISLCRAYENRIEVLRTLNANLRKMNF